MTYNPNAPLDEIVFKPEDMSSMITPLNEVDLIAWRESTLKYIFSKMREDVAWLADGATIEIDLIQQAHLIDANGKWHSISELAQWDIIGDFIAVLGWASTYNSTWGTLDVWNPAARANDEDE